MSSSPPSDHLGVSGSLGGGGGGQSHGLAGMAEVQIKSMFILDPA